jgi:hypothetical protein
MKKSVPHATAPDASAAPEYSVGLLIVEPLEASRAVAAGTNVNVDIAVTTSKIHRRTRNGSMAKKDAGTRESAMRSG